MAGRNRHRPFLISPYMWNAESGRMEPAVPINNCPFNEDIGDCRIECHSWRARTTGPGFSLRVMFCHTHGEYFTVYPAGQVPYSREPVANIGNSGHDFVPQDETPAERWLSTYWSAFFTAYHTDEGLPMVRVRRETLMPRAEVLGLGDKVDVRTAESIALSLYVPGMDLHAARRTYAEGSLASICEAVQGILEKLQMPMSLILPGLMVAGYKVGRWGRPSFCDPRADLATFHLLGTPRKRGRKRRKFNRNRASASRQGRCGWGQRPIYPPSAPPPAAP